MIPMVRSMMEVYVAERLQDDKTATFRDMYATIRQEGFEVDAVSLGSIYNGLFGHIDDPYLSTPEEVEEFSQGQVKEQMKELREEMMGEVTPAKRQEIGKLPPEQQAATWLGGMFKAFIEGMPSEKTKSAMRTMQDLMITAIKNTLPESQKKSAPTDIVQTLTKFFNTEENGFKTLNGGMNTLRTLFNETKNQVEAYVQELTAPMDDADAAMVREQWDQYVNGFMESAYDIMLSKVDQGKLLKEALKQVQIDGVKVLNDNGNINWKALVEYNDPQSVSDAVAKLFRDGIKDASGQEVRFSAEQARRIGDYFMELYKDKVARVKVQNATREAAKKINSASIISDFLKESEGFFRVVKNTKKPKEGEVQEELVDQVDWERAIQHMRNNSKGTTGIDVPVDALAQYLRGILDENGRRKYRDAQIAELQEEFKRIVAEKLLPGTMSVPAMRKFGELSRLNGGNAFSEHSQAALNAIVGIGQLDQVALNKLNALANAVTQVMNVGRVTPQGGNSTSLTAHRGAYAYQALSQLERSLKEVLRDQRINASVWQRVVKYVADILTSASTSLLINAMNMLENVFTGFGTNIGETFNILATFNPAMYRQLGKAQKAYWTAFASHISGGVANEVINEDELHHDLQAGERLRWRSITNEIKNNGWKGVLSVMTKSPQYAVSLTVRTLMNSFDAANNAALLQKRTAMTVYNELVAHHGGKGKADSASKSAAIKQALADMAKVMDVPPDVMREIDEQNEQIMSILRANGLHPTWFDKQQNKRDMMLSLFVDMMDESLPNATDKRKGEVARALVESSHAQATILAGKKNIPTEGGAADFILKFFYGVANVGMSIQQSAYEKMKKHEESGDYGKAATQQLWGAVAQNTMGKFLGGIAKFGVLGITATPLGYLTYRSLGKQRKDIIRKQLGEKKAEEGEHLSWAEATPEDIRKTSMLLGLQRSIAVRSIMGTTATLMYVLSKAFGDDEDKEDDWLANLQETASGRRMIQKFLPIGMALATAFIYKSKDKKGKKMPSYRAAWEYVNNIISPGGNDYTSQQISQAKTNDDIRDVMTEWLVSKMPGTFNLNQAEQFTRFGHTLKSMYDEDEGTGQVRRDEKISSEIYKKAEGVTETFMINGAIDFIKRTLDEDKKVNRFAREE